MSRFGAEGGGGPGPPAGRRILANLGFEDELRRSAGAAGPGPGAPDGGRSGEAGPSLSAAARRTAAAAGTLLRAFAAEGDRLWLPGPVPADRLGRVPGLPEPVLEHGPVEVLEPARRVLAWGESPEVSALRARWGTVEDGEPSALREPFHRAVWHVVPAAPPAVARVAHRRFCLELARDLGLALPGAGVVADPQGIERLLRGPAGAAGGGRWVVKAPYSAAGRERFVGAGAGALRSPRARRRLEGLFQRHGDLVFEPWVERLADFGCAGLVSPRGVRFAGFHRLEVDERGAFRGIALGGAGSGAPDLATAERDGLEGAFHEAAGRLAAAGYAGPFGLDAYRWRNPEGEARFHPLGELNPRLTFGLVARAVTERVRAAGARLGGLGASRDGGADDGRGGRTQPAVDGPVRLVLGRRAPPGGVPLTVPGSDGAPGAWLARLGS